MWYFGGEEDAFEDVTYGEEGTEAEELIKKRISDKPQTSSQGRKVYQPLAITFINVLQLLSEFLSSHKCYDLVPGEYVENKSSLICVCLSVSGKIVVLDTELPVKAAFFGLIENGANLQ